MKVTHLKVKLKVYANCYHKCYVTVFTKGNIIFYLYLENVNCPHHTQALHTYRINLSPFTKDFRVWGAPIET